MQLDMIVRDNEFLKKLEMSYATANKNIGNDAREEGQPSVE